MHLNEFARERVVAERARRLEGQADRSRLAAEARGRHRRDPGVRDRLVVLSCRALRLDGVGVGRGRAGSLLLSPLARLERSCTDCLARSAPACC
jgi:hypothetical protein